MGHFPEKYKLPQHTQHSIEIWIVLQLPRNGICN
jgi:hypothetical protein